MSQHHSSSSGPILMRSVKTFQEKKKKKYKEFLIGLQHLMAFEVFLKMSSVDWILITLLGLKS